MKILVEYYENGNIKTLLMKSLFLNMSGSFTGEDLKYLSTPGVMVETTEEKEDSPIEELMKK